LVVDIHRRRQVAGLAVLVHALLAGEQTETGVAGGAVVLDWLVGNGDRTVREAALAEDALLAGKKDRADPEDGEDGRAPGEPALPAHELVGVLVVVQGDARGSLLACDGGHGSAVPAARVPCDRINVFRPWGRIPACGKQRQASSLPDRLAWPPVLQCLEDM